LLLGREILSFHRIHPKDRRSRKWKNAANMEPIYIPSNITSSGYRHQLVYAKVEWAGNIGMPQTISRIKATDPPDGTNTHWGQRSLLFAQSTRLIVRGTPAQGQPSGVDTRRSAGDPTGTPHFSSWAVLDLVRRRRRRSSVPC